MKNLTSIFLMLMLSSFALATTNYTTVTATITDPSAQAWVGGTVKIDFVSGHPSTPSTLAGASFTQHYSPIVLNSSGAFSQDLPDNHIIRPLGSKWQFTICPNATATCGKLSVDVTGASISLSSVLSAAVQTPVVSANTTLAKAYADATVRGGQGAIYYNTVSNCVKFYVGTSWSCIITANPGGATTEVEFNDGGSAFGGDSTFTFNKTSHVLSITTPKLNSLTAYTCNSGAAGQLNYIAGGTGVKDIVQVCAKDGSNVWAWRAIY